MAIEEQSPWNADEREYREYLAAERSLYAWCLITHGGFSPPDAKAAAEQFYVYEPPNKYRGLVFHDYSWHWAMLQVIGPFYWLSHPELASPSSAYEAEIDRYFPTDGYTPQSG